MNELELRTALAQILENYQRCGLSRVHFDTNVTTAVRQTIEAWRMSNQVTVNEGRTAPIITTPIIAAPDIDAPINERKPSDIPTRSKSIGIEVPIGEAMPRQVWRDPDLPDQERLERLKQLDARVKACRLCTDICPHRQQTVFGVGPIRPRICFLGEAPGADEDKMGQPFVGQAGQLLTRIIAAMQLRREEVYILNALKCRPPSNRTPTDQEIAHCRPFVESQLAVLQPNFIVCLGAVAVRSLLNDKTSIGRLRGRFFQYQGARIVVTYHPAYLLRNDDAKRLVWEDMQMLMRELGIQLPGKTQGSNPK